MKPERRVITAEFKAKSDHRPISVPVEREDVMFTHIGNFLDCIRTRQTPTLNVETAARAQVAITPAVHSYCQGKVLYFDENFKIVDKAPRA